MPTHPLTLKSTRLEYVSSPFKVTLSQFVSMCLLSYRCVAGGNDDVTLVLLSHGADPLKTDFAGRLPLHDTQTPSVARILLGSTGFKGEANTTHG